MFFFCLHLDRHTFILLNIFILFKFVFSIFEMCNYFGGHFLYFLWFWWLTALSLEKLICPTHQICQIQKFIANRSQFCGKILHHYAAIKITESDALFSSFLFTFMWRLRGVQSVYTPGRFFNQSNLFWHCKVFSFLRTLPKVPKIGVRKVKRWQVLWEQCFVLR